jgi:hypothetical protein
MCLSWKHLDCVRLYVVTFYATYLLYLPMTYLPIYHDLFNHTMSGVGIGKIFI